MVVVWETKTGIRRGDICKWTQALLCRQEGRQQTSSPLQTRRTTANESYCYHPDEDRNVVLRRQFLPKCRDHSGRNAAVKTQANAGRNSRTMPALGESMVVYGSNKSRPLLLLLSSDIIILTQTWPITPLQEQAIRPATGLENGEI